MGSVKKALLIGGLATWYALTSPSSKQLEKKRDYPLPQEIRVVDTSLLCETKQKIWISESSDGTPERRIELEKIVKTDNINFSKNFYIQTDRYRLIKEEDWLPSRLVGHTLSIPGKLLFWDWDYAWGQDEHRTRAALSILEKNKELKNVTLRLNHNEAFYDMYRMFTEKRLRERNNFLSRATLGVLISLGDEIWAEFSRGSYYNPMTQTAVCYSNIESITAHELGHHKDHQRFSSDWEYLLARTFPPVMLYQEWQASQNAKSNLESFDQWQFKRYLLPAFFTYLLGSYYISKKMLQKKDYAKNGKGKDFDKLKESKKPYTHPLQTLRHFGTMNLDLYTGIAAYQACSSVNAPELLSCAAFAGGLIATDLIADTILKRIIPYNHEVN